MSTKTRIDRMIADWIRDEHDELSSWHQAAGSLHQEIG